METAEVLHLLHREHRWIRVRLVGWAMLFLWQALGLLSEFYPLELEARVLRIAGRVVGLAGLALVAVGFERVAELAHARAGHD